MLVKRKIPLGPYTQFGINLEMFDSGQEVVDSNRMRTITDSRFTYDVTHFDPDFNGVSSYDEALELLATGYPKATEKLKKYEGQINLKGEAKRIRFANEVVGFIPVVPLAIQGIPTCMVNSHTVKIQNKVLNVYYDVGAVGSVSVSEIENAGCKLLGALMELEMAGYRFNLYAIKSQTSSDGCADVLCIKIKDAGRPFDLKRLSFPIAHPAFFRAIAWNWYARVPGGKFRSGLGHSLTYEFSDTQLTEAFEKLFNQKCVVLGLKYILDKDEGYLKRALTGGQYAKV